MNQRKFDIYEYTLPLKRPAVFSGRRLNARRGLLVRLEDRSGRAGWGEVAPLPGFSRETLRAALGELRRCRAAWLKGADLRSVGFTCPSAAAGVEMAWESLERTTDRRPHRLPISGLLLDDDRDPAPAAARLRRAGYGCAKIKVGRRSVEKEIERVRLLHALLGPRILLRIDANRAWSLAEAGAFCRGVEKLPIDFIEEPLRRPVEISRLAGQTKIPLALDECIQDAPTLRPAAWKGVSVLVLKPTLIGGFRHVRYLAAEGARAGMRCVISGTFESGLGTLALARLAFSLGGAVGPAGLDTYSWLAADVLTAPLRFQRGALCLPARPIGDRQVNKARLMKRT
jgi:o-succinylbenzoate synthase